LTISEETRVTSPALKPTRSRTASKTALPDAAATRPHISVYVMIPSTPITTTQRSWYPKVAPAATLKTRSPMSTKPPIAARIPSATFGRIFTGSYPPA